MVFSYLNIIIWPKYYRNCILIKKKKLPKQWENIICKMNCWPDLEKSLEVSEMKVHILSHLKLFTSSNHPVHQFFTILEHYCTLEPIPGISWLDIYYIFALSCILLSALMILIILLIDSVDHSYIAAHP